MDRKTEVGIKHERIRKYLKTKVIDGVLLSSVANFSWLTAGGDSHVENHSKYGVALLLVTDKNKYVITNNIEADRLLTEELKGVELEFEFIISKWYDALEQENYIKSLTSGRRIATETFREGNTLLKNDFVALRYELTESEIERYRWLGKQCGLAIESVARELIPGMSEHEIEAAMAQKLMAGKILPVVLLVAGDERNYKYRHPVPTGNKFTRFAKLVCCARKWGLVAALTRSIYVGDLPKDLKEKQEAVAYIDSVFLAQTVPGAHIRNVFNEAIRAYAKAGFPNEWQLHHQGGAIGYDAREYIGTLDCKEVVGNTQAFAWNPSVQGNKSEDTAIISSGEPELLTMTGNWPVIDMNVGGMIFKRPAILEI
ncbi:MAG: M24 family metallopeptidase [Desulfobacterales bacterium]|nr:M24 family metallopeptidase [Desulfobacterales bacterium]